MAKEKEYKFEMEYAGKTYSCIRVVTGTRVLKQTIYVGIDSEADSVDYGPKHHPVETMDGIARIIAGQIIRRQGK